MFRQTGILEQTDRHPLTIECKRRQNTDRLDRSTHRCIVYNCTCLWMNLPVWWAWIGLQLPWLHDPWAANRTPGDKISQLLYSSITLWKSKLACFSLETFFDLLMSLSFSTLVDSKLYCKLRTYLKRENVCQRQTFQLVHLVYHSHRNNFW